LSIIIFSLNAATHRLHVVDESVALVPGAVIATAEGHGPEVHMLVGLGQQLDAIVDQGHAVGQGAGHCGWARAIKDNVVYHFRPTIAPPFPSGPWQCNSII